MKNKALKVVLLIITLIFGIFVLTACENKETSQEVEEQQDVIKEAKDIISEGKNIKDKEILEKAQSASKELDLSLAEEAINFAITTAKYNYLSKGKNNFAAELTYDDLKEELNSQGFRFNENASGLIFANDEGSIVIQITSEETNKIYDVELVRGDDDKELTVILVTLAE